MATNPIIADYQRLQRLPVPTDTPPVIAQPMPVQNAMPALPAPAQPIVRQQDPAIAATNSRILGDQNDYQRKLDTGSGISQIKNPLLRGLATAGDIAERIIVPRAESVTPGTEGNHERLLRIGQGRIGEDLGQQKEQAETTLLDAQPQLKQLGLENQTLKTQGQLGHWQDQADHWTDQTDTNLRDHGYKRDSTGKMVPLSYEELSPQQQAIEDLKHAQQEQDEANAALKKAQNDPSSPAFRLAKQRADAATINAQTAIGKLSVARGNQQLRKNEYDMHAFGTDANGNELPGVLHDENGHAVGSVQAGNVKPTTTERDAAGRADSMVDIGNRLRTALADPEIQSYLGPIRGRVSDAQGSAGMLPEKVAKFRNDLVSYGAFQAGLHPVRGIGALQYFDKVMGGLGQNAGSLLGKLNSNDETAADVQRVGTMPTTAGIARANSAPNAPARGNNHPQTYRQTATGPNGHKIGSNDGDTWFDVQTGKAIQ